MSMSERVSGVDSGLALRHLPPSLASKQLIVVASRGRAFLSSVSPSAAGGDGGYWFVVAWVL